MPIKTKVKDTLLLGTLYLFIALTWIYGWFYLGMRWEFVAGPATWGITMLIIWGAKKKDQDNIIIALIAIIPGLVAIPIGATLGGLFVAWIVEKQVVFEVVLRTAIAEGKFSRGADELGAGIGTIIFLLIFYYNIYYNILFGKFISRIKNFNTIFPATLLLCPFIFFFTLHLVQELGKLDRSMNLAHRRCGLFRLGGGRFPEPATHSGCRV